ncbi:hypothetical protein ANANG_G00226480 [Anguilla anguilla]|uniref:Uncharacterized protein n=1 Tax=Anguilla anguilla TaxID=7936 RepID=A0A9D3LX54_ANGAN|nr:hypothetical protein ANANG_G00226480 [Anguilla anguilla]
MPPSPVPGPAARPSSLDKRSSSVETATVPPPSSKLPHHKTSVSRLVEEFFWIGSSVLASSMLKLGQFGEQRVELSGYYAVLTRRANSPRVISGMALRASASRSLRRDSPLMSRVLSPAAPGLLHRMEKCMSSMQTGTQMVKLRGGSKGLVRFYYLDEHKSCIRWRPSRKNERAKISIDSIREVCEGKQSEIFQRYSDGSFDPNCCFSIYYGEHMESLDLVSTSGEEARTWITGLKYLVAGISDEDSLAKRQRTRDQYPFLGPVFSLCERTVCFYAFVILGGASLTLALTWLKQTFAEADKNGDGSLSISEVLQLLHKLNVNLPRQKVKQMFKEADTDENQGTLGFEEFCTFYKMMSTRRDLYLLMLTYSNHKDHMDTDNLIRFLEVEQKMTNVTKEHCLEIVSKFEPCPENQQQGVLGIDGFTNYMRSPSGTSLTRSTTR